MEWQTHHRQTLIGCGQCTETTLKCSSVSIVELAGYSVISLTTSTRLLTWPWNDVMAGETRRLHRHTHAGPK